MQATPQRTSLLPLAALLLAGTGAAQTTWYIDDDGQGDPFPGVSIPGNPTFSDPAEDGSPQHPFDDVYKGVAAAANGDTVLVLPSNYVGAYFLTSPLDLAGKAIRVTSSGGPAVTQLDGTGIPGQSGVRFDSGEGPTTVFEGFTLTNFHRGGTAGSNGGALFISNASPTIRGCRFTGNLAYVGASAFVSNSNALFEACTFEFESSVHQGGAVYTDNGQPIFAGCTFEGNQANFGGAFLSRTTGGGHVSVQDCVFIGNQSLTGYAGALAKFDGGQITVERSRFLSNVSAKEGAGAHISGGGLIQDCIFNTNTSLSNQGAISIASSGTGTVRGCTITNNTGGGMTEIGGVIVGVIQNSIVWDNAPYELGINIGASYSNVMGGYSGVGVIDFDPKFVDPWGLDGVRGTLDDDLSLRGGSPCIDAGDTTLVAIAYPVDLAGAPRAVNHPAKIDAGVTLVGQTVDMGAFEYQAIPDCNRVVAPQQFP